MIVRINSKILGITELKCMWIGELNAGGDYINYHRWECHRRNGVALIINKDSEMQYLGAPSKMTVILVHFQGKPFSLTVIQVYAPVRCQRRWSWSILWRARRLLELTLKTDVLFIIGDWYSKLVCQLISGVIGNFGLGELNEAEQSLSEFCQKNALVITNTFFSSAQ